MDRRSYCQPSANAIVAETDTGRHKDLIRIRLIETISQRDDANLAKGASGQHGLKNATNPFTNRKLWSGACEPNCGETPDEGQLAELEGLADSHHIRPHQQRNVQTKSIERLEVKDSNLLQSAGGASRAAKDATGFNMDPCMCGMHQCRITMSKFFEAIDPATLQRHSQRQGKYMRLRVLSA